MVVEVSGGVILFSYWDQIQGNVDVTRGPKSNMIHVALKFPI